MKKLFSILIVLLMGCIMCAKNEAKIEGEPGGRLVIGTTDFVSEISPLKPNVFASNELLDLLFLRLHRVDPATGKMVPELAVSWEFSEDLSSITYYLRKDVKWWDGKPVTADDIIFTYKKMKDPKTAYPNIASLRFIKKVEKVNDYAVRFTFSKVYADLLTDSNIMPVARSAYKKLGADFGQMPVGNGPYKLKEFVPGSGALLVVNKEFYRGRPPLDEIYIRFYSNSDDMISDFSNGTLDLVLNIDPGAAKELEKNKNIRIDSRPGNSYTFIGWNLRNGHLRDKEVRKALSLAINEKMILNEVFKGMGKLSLGPLPPSSWAYNSNIKPLGYDLKKAQAILAKKGFEDRNRNKILDKDRKDFILNLITNVESPERVKMLRLVADDLKKLGIKVKARALDTRSFIKALIKGDFDGYIMAWSVDNKIDPTVSWSSDPKKGRYNFIGYKNPKVDTLINLASSMLDRKKAKKLWGEFQRIVYQDIPYTFLVAPDRISATYKRVRGIKGGISLSRVYTYWIPKNERRVAVAVNIPAKKEKKPTEEVIVSKTETVKETPEEKAKSLKKPPVTVTPEKLLAAAAKKETTAVAKEVAPIPPPKPSVITRAKPIKKVQPRYPEAAKSIAAQGRVVVRVLVGKDGKVKKAEVIKSFGNPACEEAAIAAAKKWVFKPATKDGVPFEQRIYIPFDFKP